MIAFAGNSLLCRLALKQTGIDAATFTFRTALARRLLVIVKARKVVVGESGNLAFRSGALRLCSCLSLRNISLSAGRGRCAFVLSNHVIRWGLRRGNGSALYSSWFFALAYPPRPLCFPALCSALAGD